MAELLLHIGMPKTGTTAIQHFLSANTSQLRTHRVVYDQYRGADKCHDFLVHWVHKGQWGEVEAFLDQLLTEEAHTVILSCGRLFAFSSRMATRKRDLVLVESHWETEQKAIHQLLDILQKRFSKIRIAVFLRRQDLALESAFNQAVKKGSWRGEDIAEFLSYAHCRFDYARILKMWSDSLSPQNLHIGVYERDKFVNHDIRYEFLKLLDLSDETFTFESKTKHAENIRLPREILEYKAILNRIEKPRSREFIFRRALRQIAHDMALDSTRWQNFLTSEQRKQLLLDFSEGNRWVAELSGKSSPLFDESDITNHQDEGDYPGLAVETAVEIYLRLSAILKTPHYRRLIRQKKFQEFRASIPLIGTVRKKLSRLLRKVSR